MLQEGYQLIKTSPDLANLLPKEVIPQMDNILRALLEQKPSRFHSPNNGYVLYMYSDYIFKYLLTTLIFCLWLINYSEIKYMYSSLPSFLILFALIKYELVRKVFMDNDYVMLTYIKFVGSDFSDR